MVSVGLLGGTLDYSNYVVNKVATSNFENSEISNKSSSKDPSVSNKNVSEDKTLDKYLKKVEKKMERCRQKRITYQDGSNDPAVTFKLPQAVSIGASEYAVRAHELQHVVHETARAIQEGKNVSTMVRIIYRYDPECGRYYPVGGRTYVLTWGEKENKRQKQGDSEQSLNQSDQVSVEYPAGILLDAAF